ncbi:MAG: biosynthetic arginine decarboxylase [Saccharospirillaceae bacterium]|nr:biosynthetic arginine decarboxylase [Pseudomonadales bacterium]NRB77495.1 biosynthetic arginine decarboxylase [Saccharospirillaceae bacterium]
MSTNWSIKDTLNTYNIDKWSEGYFDVNTQGNLTVCPPNLPAIELTQIVEQIERLGVQTPILLRFPFIIADRIKLLNVAFNKAIRKHQYKAEFLSVYPIKVNQQHSVVNQIIAGQNKVQNIGLESGSKAELLTIIAQAKHSKQGAQATLICNGYKDQQYIELALIAKKMGHKCVIVVEKSSELSLVLHLAKQLNVLPSIGLRARLSSIGKGNWQNSGGEKSKFGLTAKQILMMIEQLKQSEQLDCLELLHFHLGSQVADIMDIQTGISEAAQILVQLNKLGADIDTVDVGGGLGVDYEGTQSVSACSMNYSINDYAEVIVQSFAHVCLKYKIKHPQIISESGRAVTAHHAVLISNVLSCETKNTNVDSLKFLDIKDKHHPIYIECVKLYAEAKNLKTHPFQAKSVFDKIEPLLSKSKHHFLQGDVDLSLRAFVEETMLACALNIKPFLNTNNHQIQRDHINEWLAAKLFVNFSLFQSLPDAWGIDQVFPVLPLSGLDRPCTSRVVIQDITCDSDGRLDDYVDGQGIETTLPWPEFETQPDVAFFMLGAYQEILGDMHNLFGDTASVDVVFNESGFELNHLQNQQSTDSVLSYVNFDSTSFKTSFEEQLSGHPERNICLEKLYHAFDGGTYLKR